MASAATLWTWGWLAVLMGGMISHRYPESFWAVSLGHLSEPLLPGFLLAGACVHCGLRAPGWLLPAAVVLGLTRVATEWLGVAGLGYGATLVLEPAGAFVAANVLWRHRAAIRRTWTSDLLPISFAGVGLSLGWVSGMRALGVPSPPWFEAYWVLLCGATIGLQATAAAQAAAEGRRRSDREQHRVRRALDESEERFRALTENSFEIVAELDGTGVIHYANPRLAEMVGMSAGAGGVPQLEQFLHPAELGAALGWLQAATQRRAEKPLLTRWRAHGGDWRWVESTVRAFETAEGDARLVLSARDVTDRTRMEQELRDARDRLEDRVTERTAQLREAIATLEQEASARRSAEVKLRTSHERYRSISELSSDLSFGYVLSESGELRDPWVTDAFQRITGYRLREAEEMGWEPLIHPEDRHVIAELREAGPATGERQLEFRIRTKSGDTRWLYTRVGSFAGEAEGELRFVGVTRDVTEERRAAEDQRRFESHLSEVQRLESLGVLAGGIAHDFNNLLSVILGNSSLALGEVPPDSPVRRRIERIRSSARHAVSLTDQMLTYSGRANVVIKPLDVSRLVSGMVDLLEASIAGSTELVIEPGADLPLMEGDETQIRQVVLNLVTNASEALEGRPGRVTVRTGCVAAGSEYPVDAFGLQQADSEEYVYLEVEDEGVGIDEAMRARIFEPFFSTKFTGRGLGMAAVLGIVRGHRGTIELDSEPGRGSTFRVHFPQARALDAIAAAPVRSSRRDPATVLVIDDDEAGLELAGELLGREGFDVLLASSGREGVELFRERRDEIDVVLLDLVMPDWDGERCLEELARIRPNVPVVMISGFSEEWSTRGIDGPEIRGFVRKPYEPDKLVAVLLAAAEEGD